MLTWIGNGAQILIARALEWATAIIEQNLDRSQIATLKERFNVFYGEKISVTAAVYSSRERDFAETQSQRLPFAVVTNKPTQHTRPVLKAFGIEDLFDEVLGGQSLLSSNLTRARCSIYAANSALYLETSAVRRRFPQRYYCCP